MNAKQIMECVKAGYKPSEIAELSEQLKNADPDVEVSEEDVEEKLQETEEVLQNDVKDIKDDTENVNADKERIAELERQLKEAQLKNVHEDLSDKDKQTNDEKLSEIVRGFF